MPYLYRPLFGRGAPGFAPPAGFDPPAETLVPGGVERATTMMRNLFRQRVSDVALLLRTVRLLGAEEGVCRTTLSATGAVSAARDPCGLLAGHVDGERVGVAGHSLGAMTTQLAANHLPGVAAAMGIDNVPPFTWDPEEMYGAGAVYLPHVIRDRYAKAWFDWRLKGAAGSRNGCGPKTRSAS